MAQGVFLKAVDTAEVIFFFIRDLIKTTGPVCKEVGLHDARTRLLILDPNIPQTAMQ